MEIRTSYFAQLKKLKGYTPVAICQYPPKWYDGAVYKKVAPTYEMIQGMKDPLLRDFFIEKYRIEILNQLSTDEVKRDLAQYGDKVVLLCFEKPSDFCHRHVLAAWLGLDPRDAEIRF